MEYPDKLKDEPWRVLEFYSGIGGMRYSLMRAGVNYKVVEAFDINDIANDVYEHNFGHRPHQVNIQSLSVDDLNSYGAHAWLLSPPCQPYTRQGLQKHSDDARAVSFINILELIPHLSRPPLMLFVENVVGFETSDTHTTMIDVLSRTNFDIQEFILSPIQFGIPYSRPRYFCLAKRRPFPTQSRDINCQLLRSPSILFGHDDDKIVTAQQEEPQESWDKLLHSCEPIERFLEFKSSSSRDDTVSNFCETPDVSTDVSVATEKRYEETVSGIDSLDQYMVPAGLIDRCGGAMDIVYPDSKRCCCFTKSYYRYVKGTGSLLATTQPTLQGKSSSLKDQHLRYFTPREVANLHSFPKDFCFPQHVSLKQRYALLGNSLSIAVVAPLLGHLFM